MSRNTPQQRSDILTLIASAGLVFIAPMQADSQAGEGLSAQTSNMVRLEMVAVQLEAFSDMSFPVEIYDTGVGGMALPGGQIQVDPWLFMFEDEALAWLVGHEWGHQALGHVTNQYYSVSIRGDTPTALEDDADFFAGQFLGFAGYDIDIAAEFVEAAADDSSAVHSSGVVRAATTRAGYADFLSGNEEVMEELEEIVDEVEDTQSQVSGSTLVLDRLQTGSTTGLGSTLIDEGFHPDNYVNRKGKLKKKKLKKALRSYYKSSILPYFDSKRKKKDKKSDIALMFETVQSAAASIAQQHSIHEDSPFAEYQQYGYGCACGNH